MCNTAISSPSTSTILLETSYFSNGQTYNSFFVISRIWDEANYSPAFLL